MKINRNEPCPCGSGKKYKHCCYAKDTVKHDEPIIAAPESTDEDVTETSDDEAGSNQSKKSHQKDRSRFKGEVRGGSSGFTPRTTRGAQRGS